MPQHVARVVGGGGGGGGGGAWADRGASGREFKWCGVRSMPRFGSAVHRVFLQELLKHRHPPPLDRVLNPIEISHSAGYISAREEAGGLCTAGSVIAHLRRTRNWPRGVVQPFEPLYKVEQLPPIRQFVVPGRVSKSGQTAAFHFGDH